MIKAYIEAKYDFRAHIIYITGKEGVRIADV
ncbi:hypothetical protein IMSAGC011_02873 [Lachnospiraceae bacterium]|nr:hypothetical protein IMSAGC011_02873 [Lachnospiraceae bacterium]